MPRRLHRRELAKGRLGQYMKAKAQKFRPMDYDMQEVDTADAESLRAYATHLLMSSTDPSPAQLKRIEAIQMQADKVEKAAKTEARSVFDAELGKLIAPIDEARARLMADRQVKRAEPEVIYTSRKPDDSLQ